MAWNIRALRIRIAPTAGWPAAPSPHRSNDIPPSARGQLLAIFRRLAAVLQLTAKLAESTGRLEPHAALGARLAIFRARVEAGETSPLLATALADFGREFQAFITDDLGFRRP